MELHLACILRGDPATYKIRIDGKTFLFEFSERLGPIVVDAQGRQVKEPSSRSIFWEAVGLWRDQGKRIRDGFCLWTPKPIPILEPLGGRNYKFIGETVQEDRW